MSPAVPVGSTTSCPPQSIFLGSLGNLVVAQQQMNGAPSNLSFSAKAAASSPAEESWLDGLLMPIFAVDRSGTVVEWNRHIAVLTGYSRCEAVRKHASTFLDMAQQHRDQWERALTQTLAGTTTTGGDGGSCEVVLVGKHLGSQWTCRVMLVCQQSPAHDPEGALCFLEVLASAPAPEQTPAERVVSLPCLADHRLGDSHPKKVVDSSSSDGCQPNRLPDDIRIRTDTLPVVILDDQGVITYWNRPMAELTGAQLHELQSNPQRLDELFADFQTTVQSILDRPGAACHVTVCRATGERVQRLACSNAVPSSGPNLRSGVAILLYEVNGLSSNDDTSRVPFIGVDVTGRVDRWSSAAASLFHVDPGRAIGHDFVDRFCSLPEERDGLLATLQKAWVGGESLMHETEYRSPSGESLVFIANTSSRRDRLGRINGATIVAHDVTDLATRCRALSNSAAELRFLVDTATTPIFGVDGSGLVDEWNDKMHEMTGFSKVEALHQCFISTFVAPGHHDSVQNVIFSALTGRGTSNSEFELLGKDSESRFLLVNATTRRDAAGNIVGMVGFSHDVTEACKHDRAVASMASELRQLIDTANAPIFGIDCDGDVNEWNDKTAEITGYTKEEAFDCSLVETFIAPSMQESVQDILDRALQGRGTSNYELEFLTKSNEIRNLLVNATTRRDAENNVVGVVGVAQDVTEAVQRDRAVAGMALELRQLIDSANAPIFGIDIDGNVNEWNRRTQEITGYSKEETFDEPLVERFIAPLMRETVQRILDEALQGNETSNFELEIVTKTGDPCFMLVNATTRRDPEFNVVGVVSVAQDVTEDRKHAAELRKMHYLQATQEAKVETERNMTAYFAHELRNPLSAIDSALSSMPDDLPKSARSLVSGMQLCSTFMSTIMNNLLDVRKMEEGKMTLHVVPLSLESLVSGVHEMLLPSVKPGVAFTRHLETEGRDWVLGDQHRIQQVLTNVVTNAIKYTVTGSIELKLSWEGGFVKFECSDTGPGIPKNEQEKLFQRFVQRGGAPGTGLGLAIAKHLVDLHNGRIRFDSDPTVKAGTTCIVHLPLSLCDPPELREADDEDNSMIEQPLKFLIIDDVKMNRMMLNRRIKKGIAPNCSIFEASTGEEALEICGVDNFDVIIVDQYMEEAGGIMVGTDVVYAMRRMRIDSIIVGCSGNELDREFTEAGANWVWKKPMPSNSEIVSHLRVALAQRALALGPRAISIHGS